MPSMLSRKDVARYDEDGYIFVRGLFDAEETDLLRRAMEEDPAIRDHSLLRADQEGGATRISLWNRAGDSVYGLAARTPRVVDTAEALIGEPVYHFQSKLTAKDRAWAAPGSGIRTTAIGIIMGALSRKCSAS